MNGDNTHVDHDGVDRNKSVSSRRFSTAADKVHENTNAKLANPLAFESHQTLRARGREYALKHFLGDAEDVRAFELGACIAQDHSKWDRVEGLTDAERQTLTKEIASRWSQPRLLYLIIVLCSTCAAVQGMDETVVNGAQVFYKPQFGIGGHDETSTWLVGLVNSAPYLCCAFIGCWLAVPFNNVFGRRGTVFITCLFSAIACIWQALTNTWWHMFVARFALGFGIGPKSATVPIYAAETTPPPIRGALVMQWQMWTAFGIMLGYFADLAFFPVVDTPGSVGLNWRLMMGSACFPAVIVCCFVFMCPESPRWYMSKGQHYKAYESMCRLRYNKVQAARDLFYMHTLLEAESSIVIQGKWKILELVRVPRNRRAMLASEIELMFMQQFCGVNVMAYYSTTIFLDANFSEQQALAASCGFGIINWLFAIPAIYTIDTFGRRNLLLFTFPLMSLFLFLIAFSFLIPNETGKLAGVSLGIYLFAVVYSPGEGPVPFTYSAEAYPLYVRPLGMALATATTWFFNFVLSITFPSLERAFTDTGAFCWYAAWNIVGWVLVLLFLPETKGLSLEELDQVFSVPTHKHAAWAVRSVGYFFRRYILLQKNAKLDQLYEREEPTEPNGFHAASNGEKGGAGKTY